jgi:ubiquinone/menaquinone biosynthesis C-methylase UbiE
MITQTKTYDTRSVEYKKIHSVPDDLYTKVIESLDLFPGAILGDLMAGHGEMSDAIITYCSSKGFKVQGIMLDAYAKQLPESHEFARIVGDIRHPVLSAESLDRTVMKLGLHEIPQKDKQQAISQVYRVLKQEGIGVFWELGFKDSYEQQIFHQIVRKKDELAGFHDLVRDRYFCRESELREYFQKCGFKQIEVVYQGTFYIHTSKWLEGDFGKDETKLEELDKYIMQIPEQTRKKYGFKKEGQDICMEFSWPVFRVTK